MRARRSPAAKAAAAFALGIAHPVTDTARNETSPEPAGVASIWADASEECWALSEFSPRTLSYNQPEEPNGKGRKISYSGNMW
jgi:hypothetical protein